MGPTFSCHSTAGRCSSGVVTPPFSSAVAVSVSVLPSTAVKEWLDLTSNLYPFRYVNTP